MPTSDLRSLITQTAATVQQIASRQQQLADQVDHLHQRLFVANGHPPLVVQVEDHARRLHHLEAARRGARGFLLDLLRSLAPAALVGAIAWVFWVHSRVSAADAAPAAHPPSATQKAGP